MHRLFVALRPPPALRTQLLMLMDGIPGARWQTDEQLHLTLRFIGEVDRPQADDIASALAGIEQPRPTVALKGVGSFDHKGQVHSLWAGVTPDDALKRLHDRIEWAVSRAGIPPDRRAFKPHITIARLGRQAGPVAPFLVRNAGLTSASATLDAFILFESRLGRDGASYQAIARYPLA